MLGKRTMIRSIATAALVCMSFAPVLFAQSSDAAAGRPEFEVASIKPNTGAGRGRKLFIEPGGRLTVENLPLRFLIRFAYNVKDFQISGGPAWMNSDPWDISAKAETERTPEQLRPLVQSLLASRFKLALHRETKELPIYQLAAARGGLKLTSPKQGSCITPDPDNPPRPPAPGEPPPRYCGNVRMGPGLIEAWGVSMERLLMALSDTLGRTVIDKTGFTGTFDVHLEFNPDDTIADAADAIVGGRTVQPPPPADSATPSIFTALQEQLGLKMDSAKGPVEVLIIDHVERPSEN
jgi:uncharacterized protein (TIGR03435 family)